MEKSRPLISALVSVMVAMLIVGVFTLLRAGLAPTLDDHSPYMLYVAAVLIASFLRSRFCGFVVLVASGLAGSYFFVEPAGELTMTPSAITALGIFWAVSALVLLAAHEMRGHVLSNFARIGERLNEIDSPPAPEKRGA